MPTSSSLTILTTCCAGLSAPDTSAPLARSLIRCTKARTTGSDTSASSSASRISRVVASISASVRRPLPRRPARAPVSRSDSDSNTPASLVVIASPAPPGAAGHHSSGLVVIASPAPPGAAGHSVKLVSHPLTTVKLASRSSKLSGGLAPLQRAGYKFGGYLLVRRLCNRMSAKVEQLEFQA